MREVEDILLSQRDGGVGSKGNGRASYSLRARDGNGREMAHKKVQISAKMLRNRAT